MAKADVVFVLEGLESHVDDEHDKDDDDALIEDEFLCMLLLLLKYLRTPCSTPLLRRHSIDINYFRIF